MTIRLTDPELEVKGTQIENLGSGAKRLKVTDSRSGNVTRIKLEHRDTYTPRTRTPPENGYDVEEGVEE